MDDQSIAQLLMFSGVKAPPPPPEGEIDAGWNEQEDSDEGLPPTTDNREWEYSDGSGWGIVDGDAYVVESGGGEVFAVVDTGGANVDIVVSFSAIDFNQHMKIVFRYKNANQFLALQVDPDGYYIYRKYGSNYVRLNGAAIAPLVGDVVRVELRDINIDVYLTRSGVYDDEHIVHEANDLNMNGSKHGIGAGGAGDGRWSTFSVTVV